MHCMRTWALVGVSALGLAVLPASAQAPEVVAQTYYVAADGTPQGDGSEAEPYDVATFFKRVKLQPGDEVVFLDGVYDLSRGSIMIRTIGTAEKPITYRAKNRHKAILDGGTRVTGWKKVPGGEPVWEARVESAPRNMLLVNGEGLISATWNWARRDKKKTLEEGMFTVEKAPDGQGFRLLIYPWKGEEPKEVFLLSNQVISVSGAFNIVDGFLLRRSQHGIHLGGRLVHTYRLKPGLYRDLCGLVNNLYGSFNIVRNCIIRDMTGQGMTSNESRFNLIEDCVIYNAGMGQGMHGIYISQGAENLTLRRNVWWRTSGGAIHIYSGSGIDSPRNIVVEYNIFGPDKRNRCFPLQNRKSTALYVWGGHRRAGHNRIVHNIVIGPHDRAISMHRSNFNLVAHNLFLNSDGAPIQIGTGFGNLIVNNIIEYSPGGEEPGAQARPGGYYAFPLDNMDQVVGLGCFTHNLLLPRAGQGTQVPPFDKQSKVAAADPFVDRAHFDFRLKTDSEAVDMGIRVPGVTTKVQGAAPDVGPLEVGEEPSGAAGKFPEIPRWLLEEWPLSKRGQ